MSGNLDDCERKILKLEGEQKSQREIVDAIKGKLMKDWPELDRSRYELDNKLREIKDKAERTAKDLDDLSETTEKRNDQVREELQEFVDHVVTSLQEMTENFRSAIDKVTDAFTKKIVEDHEPRIRKLEKQLWTYAGIIGFVGFAVMAWIEWRMH